MAQQHTKVAPSFAIVLINLDDSPKELESLVESFAALEKHSDRVHGGGRVRVGL